MDAACDYEEPMTYAVQPHGAEGLTCPKCGQPVRRDNEKGGWVHDDQASSVAREAIAELRAVAHALTDAGWRCGFSLPEGFPAWLGTTSERINEKAAALEARL